MPGTAWVLPSHADRDQLDPVPLGLGQHIVERCSILVLQHPDRDARVGLAVDAYRTACTADTPQHDE